MWVRSFATISTEERSQMFSHGFLKKMQVCKFLLTLIGRKSHLRLHHHPNYPPKHSHRVDRFRLLCHLLNQKWMKLVKSTLDLESNLLSAGNSSKMSSSSRRPRSTAFFSTSTAISNTRSQTDSKKNCNCFENKAEKRCFFISIQTLKSSQIVPNNAKISVFVLKNIQIVTQVSQSKTTKDAWISRREIWMTMFDVSSHQCY